MTNHERPPYLKDPPRTGHETPAYRQVLTQFQQVRDRYVQLERAEDAREMWHRLEGLVSWLDVSGHFPLGRQLMTQGAMRAMQRQWLQPVEFLLRHRHSDWGELDEMDTQQNDHAVRHGGRILSSYRMTDTGKLWVITEADRSATTLLLPEEY